MLLLRQVHAPAAEDAWLGLPPAASPATPATDTRDAYTAGRTLTLPGWLPCSRQGHSTRLGPPTTQLLLTEVHHFHSLAAAVEAACDGDAVLVLSGAHVVSQVCCVPWLSHQHQPASTHMAQACSCKQLARLVSARFMSSAPFDDLPAVCTPQANRFQAYFL
jgi:hypothetical protein